MEVELGPYAFRIPTEFGPRILDLRLRDSPSLFASLADHVGITRPDSELFRFRGGHRLWAAPEIPSITYANDDHPCELVQSDEALTVSGTVDSAGLVKRFQVSIDQNQLVVDHHLLNKGSDPLVVAPWAITQFRMGGHALLPLGDFDPLGLQGDRSLTIWPYTDLSDSRLSFSRDVLTIAALPGPAWKIGLSPGTGRLGYQLDGHLFVKEFDSTGGGQAVDRGAVAEVFVERDFCELESLGRISRLGPDEEVTHRERWWIEPSPSLEAARDRLRSL